jgi:hypothetical protein
MVDLRWLLDPISLCIRRILTVPFLANIVPFLPGAVRSGYAWKARGRLTWIIPVADRGLKQIGQRANRCGQRIAIDDCTNLATQCRDRCAHLIVVASQDDPLVDTESDVDDYFPKNLFMSSRCLVASVPNDQCEFCYR